MTPRSERDILADILLAVGSRSDARAWRQQAGVFVPMSGSVDCPRCGHHGSLKGFQPRPVTRVGVDGMGDVGMILGPHGRACWIEAKSESGRQRESQANFQRMVESQGGVYILARSAEDAIGQLRARGYCCD